MSWYRSSGTEAGVCTTRANYLHCGAMTADEGSSEPDSLGCQLEVLLKERLDGPDVLPVAIKQVGIHLTPERQAQRDRQQASKSDMHASQVIDPSGHLLQWNLWIASQSATETHIYLTWSTTTVPSAGQALVFTT